MNTGNTRRAQQGMTLVDVVMAVAILGIMAGGIFGSFRYGVFTLQLVRENQRATQVILEKMETIRLYSWDQINSNGFVPATFTNVYDPQAGSGAQGVTYNGTATVADCTMGTSYATNMKLLTITLSWNTRDVTHTRSLGTYIAKDGLQNYVY
jgi:type II secretory pathway pseudopilin PulG